MALQTICPPALIYLIFSVTQIIIDTTAGLYNTALMKFFVAILFTTLLNYLCVQGLGIISWIIVFIPFILMTLIITMLLFMFGMDPKTGSININSNTQPQPIPVQPDARMDAIAQQSVMPFPVMPTQITPMPVVNPPVAPTVAPTVTPTPVMQDVYYDSKTNKTVALSLAS